jgi:hypothetical protein
MSASKPKPTDSRECRNCRAVDSMDRISNRAQMMLEDIKNGAKSIDYHKSIAHKLPKIRMMSMSRQRLRKNQIYFYFASEKITGARKRRHQHRISN